MTCNYHLIKLFIALYRNSGTNFHNHFTLLKNLNTNSYRIIRDHLTYTGFTGFASDCNLNLLDLQYMNQKAYAL